MANDKRKFVVSLEIDSKTAEQQIKASGKNIEKILSNIGSASDRITYFKGLVDEIANVDRQLSDFKNKFGEKMFNEMFAGFNANIEGQLKETIGLTRQQLNQLDELYNKKSKIQQTLDVLDNKSINNLDTLLPKGDKEQLKWLQQIVEGYKTARDAKEDFEKRNATGDDGYLKAVEEYASAAKQLKSVFDIDADGDKFGNKSSDYIAGQLNIYREVEDGLLKLYNNQKETLSKIKSLYSSEMQGINDEIKKLMTSPLNNISDYDKLSVKLKELVDIYKKIDEVGGKDVELGKQAYAIQEEIVLLDKLGNEAEDVEAIIYDLIYGDRSEVAIKDTLSQLVNMLGIELPRVAEKAEDALKIDQDNHLDKVASGFTTITGEAKKASEEVQRVMYHLGNLFSKQGRSDAFFETMPYDLTGAVEGNEKFEKYGFGVLGGGLFGVTDPSTIDGNQVTGSKFVHAIDLSKYNMYIADTEERAANLMEFMSKLQKFAMKNAEPNYTGFDAQLENVNVDTLYDNFQSLFEQSDLTKKQLDAFIDEMTDLLKQAGLKFNAEEDYLGFTNIGELEGTENISTRFMKMLGYQGVNVGTTSFDGLGQGSVLFDFEKTDIVGYFNTIESAVRDYQKISEQLNGNEWVGTIQQLEQYKINIGEIITRLKEYRKSSIGKYKEDSPTIQGVDQTIANLENVQKNIESALSGHGGGQFKSITGGVDEYLGVKIPSAVDKANVALEEAENKFREFEALADKVSDKSFYGGASDNVEIGKYIQQLNDAKSTLYELGQQGLLTSDQLESVNNMYNKAIDHLQDETRYYTGYGDYDYSYEYEYENVQNENRQLREDISDYIEEVNELTTENIKLRDQISKQQAVQDKEVQYDDIDEDLVRENGLLEDKLELLREISEEYGSQVTNKKRERYEELNQKDMNDGLTSKEENRFYELGDEIMEADESLERFGETYDKIIVKFYKGKDKEILPDDKGLRDLFKYSDSISYDEFDGKEIKDVIFVRKQEQEVIEQTNQELKTQVQIQKQLNEAGDNSDTIVQQKKLESALEDVESQAKETADAVDKIGEGSKSVDELRQMYDTLKAAHDALPRRKIEEPDSYKYDWEKAKRYADFEYDGEDLIPWNLSFEDSLNAQENLMNRSREAIKSTYKQIRQMQSAINKHGGHLGDEVYDEADIENAKEGLMGLFEKYYEISGDLDTLDVKMTKPFQALLEQTKSEIAEREVQKKAYDAETEEIIANNRAQIESFEELHRTTRKAFEASKSKDPKYEYAWTQLPDIYTGINGDEYDVLEHYASFESNLKRMGIEIPQAAEKVEQAIEEMSHTDATPKIDSSFKSDLQETEKQAKENTEALKEEKAAQEALNQEKKEARIDTDDTAAEAKENAEAKEKEAAAHEHNADAIKKENAAKAAETDEFSIDELTDLEKLEEKIKQIKEAVELKTQAFREEGDVVSSVVKQELDALDTLSKYLDTIRVTINDIVDGLNKINNTKLNDVTDDKSQTVVDNDSTQPNINREWALETTLIETNNILERIARAVESNEDTTGLITGLEHTIKDLREAANAIKVNANDFKQKAKDDVKDTSSNDSKDTKKQKTFDEIKSDTVSSFEKYRKDVEGSIHITDEFKSKLDNLQLELANVGDTNGLNIWKQNLSDFQNEFGRYEDASKNVLIGQINSIKKEAKDAMKGLDLAIPTDDPEKRAKQEAIVQGFKDIQIESDICTSKVKSNQSAEIDALNATKKQLLENIHVYKQENDLLNSGGKSGKNYGSTAIIRETTRRNQLQAYADEVNPGFKDSKTFKLYIDAYDKLIQKRNELMSKPVLTDRDVQEFNDAKAAAAGYGKELDKMIAKANKLEGNHFMSSTIGSDIKIDDALSRKQALTDFVTQMHDANDATIKFSNNYRECTFRMKNSDGTWTKMSAVLDETSNKMYSTAGEVTKYGTAIGEFVGALKGEFLKLGRYMIASFSFMEMIQVVRQGITYIKEIDDALTDLKKVTNETDAGYDRFLQTMSQTASVVGSTVAELTQMAAEWSKLGYSISEAADLAESTAILLNVSEFEDATQASEALISTIQAFGYAAEESMDVVDIMNEIGNNYAISSDGIATALQDSASALMAGGNSMEEATAMIAAANKVVGFVPRCYSNIAA